jgi:hypothetical protein
MEYGIKTFTNLGGLNAQLSEAQLKPLWDEINEIKDNWTNGIPYNSSLAGNIEYEYALPKSVKYIRELLLPLVYEYDAHFNYFDDFQKITKSPKGITLDSLWVNFQKKYEFNPLHYHDGLVSFVIWLDTPYDMQDEMNRNSSKKSNTNVPGHFSLVYSNSVGQLQQVYLPVDKSWNGRLLLFPAKMLHCVYPFYTSDEYRISVSGNFILDA